MGIGEKKSVLRTMYQKTPAETPLPDASPEVPSPKTSTPTGVARSERFENRVERVVTHVVHAGMYFLFAVGGCAIAALLYTNYAAGLALDAIARPQRMFHDIIFVFGLNLLLILMAALMFIFFRERLPRRARWIPLAAVLALFPSSIISAFFFSPCYEMGRTAAYAALDPAALADDARAIAGLVTLKDAQPREIDSADPLFSSIPQYTQSHLHPVRVFIHHRGVMIVHSGGGFPWDQAEGIIVLLDPPRPTEARTVAAEQKFELLSSDPPIFRFKSIPDTKFLDDPARKVTTAPMWFP